MVIMRSADDHDDDDDDDVVDDDDDDGDDEKLRWCERWWFEVLVTVVVVCVCEGNDVGGAMIKSDSLKCDKPSCNSLEVQMVFPMQSVAQMA